MAFARTHLGAGDRRRMGLSFPAARLAPGTYRVTVGERTETVTVG